MLRSSSLSRAWPCFQAFSTVSEQFIVNILIMRAFVQLRELMATHKDLVQKLEELEKKVSAHDERITAIFKAVKELLTPGEPSERQKIGFQTGKATES